MFNLENSHHMQLLQQWCVCTCMHVCVCTKTGIIQVLNSNLFLKRGNTVL